MNVEKLVNSTQLDSDLTSVANAIRAKGGTSAALVFPSEFVNAVQAIPSGTAVANGIMVKSKDANGYPTEIDYCGDLYPYALGASRNDAHFGLEKIESITFKNVITSIPDHAFMCCGYYGNGIPELYFPDVISIGSESFSYARVSKITFPIVETLGNATNVFASSLVSEVYLPKLTTHTQNNASYGIFRSCTNLTYVELGSIGYRAPTNVMYQFRGCTQSTLTICIYCVGEDVDSMLSTLRTYVTGGTIIFKASETTTYNGTTYSTGETILTSEVT